MITSVLFGIIAIIEAFTGLRFLFLLIGANPGSGFVHWIYSWSNPFVAPFDSIFGQQSHTIAGEGVVTASIFDWTALIALIIYALLGAVIGGILRRAAHRV